MKHNPNLQIDGTYFQNTLENVTLQSLTATLGEPENIADQSDGKVSAQWILQTPHGVGTIYDWKTDEPLGTLTNWHIGGHNQETADFIIKQWYHSKP